MKHSPSAPSVKWLFVTRIRFQPKPDVGLALKEDAVVDELRKLARVG